MGNFTNKLISLIIILVLSVSGFLHAWEDHRFELWVKNLKNDKVLIRKSSAKSLAKLGDERAVPFLLERLEDPEAEVRAEICTALGSFGEESIKKHLTQVLYKDSSPMVKNSAKRAIDKIDAYITAIKEKKLKEMKDKLKQPTS